MTILGLTNEASKAIDSTGYHAASIAPWETVGYGQAYNDARGLGRRYTGWVYRCAGLNAANVAAQSLRVFRRRKGRDRMTKTKALSDKRRDRLLDRANGVAYHARKMLETTTDVEEIVDFDHPVVDLLTRVNPYQSHYEFIEETCLQLDLTGNGAWQMIEPKDLGYPTELHLMPTRDLRIIADQDNRVAGYIYGHQSAKRQILTPDEVVHIRYANPTDFRHLWGIGPMAAAISFHDLSTAITEVQVSTMRQGARPGLVLYSEEGLHPKTANELQAKLDAQFAAEHNAGRSMVLSGKFKVLKWSMDEKEVAFHEGARLSREFVADMFGVPMQMISVSDVNLANAVVGMPLYQTNTILPRCRRIESGLNEFVLPRFWEALGDDSVFVAYDNPVSEDLTARVDRAAKAFQAGLVTRNRALELMDEEPVSDGMGEEYWSPPAPAPLFGPMPTSPPPREVIDVVDRPALPPAEDEEEFEVVAAGESAEEVPTDAAGDPAIQETALNGAQLASLQNSLLQVGELGVEAVVGMIELGFPTMDPERIRAMVESAEATRRSRAPDPSIAGGPASGSQEPQEAREGASAGDEPSTGGEASGADEEPEGEEVGQGGEKAHRTPATFDLWIPGREILPYPSKASGASQIAKAERAIAAALRGWVSDAAGSMIQSANEDGSISADIGPDSDLGLDLQNRLSGVLDQSMLEGVAQGLSELPDVGAPEERSAIDRARAWAEDYTVRLSNSTLESMKSGIEDRLRSALQDSAEGSFRDVQERVAEATGRQSDVISRRIARTESVRMHNTGREMGWIESGIVSEKRWKTRGDPKVSAICATVEREYGTAKVGEAFVPFGQVVAGVSMTYNPLGVMVPGDTHPNCRCVTSAVF